MIKNYLLIALRNIRKRKTFTTIHVLGLSIAFAASMLLFSTALFEMSFDSFHQNKDHVFQVYREQFTSRGIEKDAPMPVPFVPAVKAEVSGVEDAARYGNGGGLVRAGAKQLETSVIYTDKSFFSMFSFPLLSGNIKDVFKGPGDIVVTRAFAQKIFGTEDVTGKSLEFNLNNKWENFIISGVISDQPANSTLKFDILSPFENFPAYRADENDWTSHNHTVFIQLKEQTKPEDFYRSSKQFINKHFAENIRSMKRDGGKPGQDGQYMRLGLIPLDQLHFSKINNMGNSVNAFFPWMLILLSCVILFVAGSNFVNLSLATSFSRAREIGVRKTFGAMKRQLVVQFWSEALLICLASLLLGGILLFAFLEKYAAITGNKLPLEILLSPRSVILFVVLFAITTLLSGGYPSWIMSNFNTINTLQGKFSLGSKNTLRNTLTVIQFFIAIVLITSTLIIIRQMDYVRNQPLGFNKHQVISIPIGPNIEPESALQQMRVKLASVRNVQNVTGTDINLGRGRDGSSSTSILGFDYKNREIKTNWLRIDYDYLITLDIPLVKGRDFSRDFATDTAAALINEKMAALMGDKDPVGKILPVDEGRGLKVIGVVKDFHFKNLHQEIKPLTMMIRPKEWPVSYIFVKVSPGNLPASMKLVQDAWKEVNPRYTTEPSFLDENTNAEYKKEERLSNIFTVGSGLAIFISCMGLFASALLSMNQRTKEIGIRKVLGANIGGIVALLSKDFAKLIMISFLIAAPLSWFMMSKWLEDFAYHITISLWTLLAGGFVVLAVALLTVSFHAVKAALANPVKSLRTE